MCVEALGCLGPALIPEFQLVDLKRAINTDVEVALSVVSVESES